MSERFQKIDSLVLCFGCGCFIPKKLFSRHERECRIKQSKGGK